MTGALRQTGALVLILASRRHQAVACVVDQSRPSWLPVHRPALTCVGGVPHRGGRDHLQAGMVKAGCDAPQGQRTSREGAEPDGVLRAPCRPRTPEPQGQVEPGGGPSGPRHCLGGRLPTLLTPAHGDVRRWGLTTAGPRRQGTTTDAPRDRVEAVERAQLTPGPPLPYDLALGKQGKRPRDGEVVCAPALSSAPLRLVGQRRWGRGGSQEGRIETRHDAVVAPPPRAPRPGMRVTPPAHLPPEQSPGAFWTRARGRALAAGVGPAPPLLVETRRADPGRDRLPRGIRVRKRSARVGPSRLEAAGARALPDGELTDPTRTRMLDQGLEAEA